MEAQENSIVMTPEMCFEAILCFSSKRFLHKCYPGALHGTALQDGQQQRGLQPAVAITGIIKGIDTAHSLRLASSAVQEERSPVNAENIALGFYHISPSHLETAMRSHIKKSILTVYIEAFVLYYAVLCLAAQNYYHF